MSDPSVISRTVEKTNAWLDEIAAGLETDRNGAYRVLRSYLHALRDRLTVDESAQLAAQLPDLIRGIYYENWDPSKAPLRYHDLSEFLDRVAAEAGLTGETSASYAVTIVAGVLRRHVSEGEIADVLAQLPKDLRPILEPTR
ncbi:MAG TPA: DUF2267 domain-containing protein [Solirubrobacterales bacterium]|nr:DUF2267 domain-containing protein [Solirubrobacterales bacterium]